MNKCEYCKYRNMDKCENCKNCNIANRREIVFFIVFVFMWLLPFIGYHIGKNESCSCTYANPTPMVEMVGEQE